MERVPEEREAEDAGYDQETYRVHSSGQHGTNNRRRGSIGYTSGPILPHLQNPAYPPPSQRIPSAATRSVQWLVLITPHHDLAVRYGLSTDEGILFPLRVSLHAQLAAVVKDFGLPSGEGDLRSKPSLVIGRKTLLGMKLGSDF